MIITTKAKIDMLEPECPVVETVQGDRHTRCLEAELYCGDQPWQIPEDAVISIRYCKPDGTTGYYDALPDGTKACSVSGNTLRMLLVHQMLTVPGTVGAQLELIQGDLILGSFSLLVHVEANLAADAVKSEDYYKYTSWEELNRAAETWFTEQNAKASELTAAVECTIGQAEAAQETAQKAAETAENMASDAQQAVSQAGVALEEAEKAAGTANEATASANQAADSAGREAGNASTAAASANAAASKANEAADKVLAAKDSFLTAAGAAMEKIRSVVDDGTDAPPIVSYASGNGIALKDAANRLFQNLKIYGKTTQDGTPMPESPVELENVGNAGSVGVTVAGKNFLDYDNFASFNGTTTQMSVDNDGYVTLINNNSYSLYPAQSVRGFTGKIFSRVEIKSTTANCNIYVRNDAADYKDYIAGVNNKNFTTEVNGYYNFMISMGANSSITFRAMASVDEDAAYEPYKEAQTLTVSTSNGLPGIPVTTGGNYTDENGQQWICDEVDFAKGVYVQRVGIIDYSDSTTPAPARGATADSGKYKWMWALSSPAYPFGTATVPTPSLCNVTSYGSANDTWQCKDRVCSNGSYVYLYLDVLSAMTQAEALVWMQEKQLKILYVLATPIETGLSAEELAAYAALHTNYPNTTIYNDAGAHMEAKYVADTKLYIDNKFTELAAALVSNS